MKLAFLIAALLATVVIRSPKDQANALRQKAAFSDKLVPPAAALVMPAKTVYVAATAYDSFGIESDFSNEGVIAYTNNQISVVWPAADDAPDPIFGYWLYWGSNSGQYSSSLNAGMNLQATFTPVPVQPSTQYFKLFAQVSTNGLQSFSDASQSPFLTVTQVSGASGPPVTLWRVRVAVTNAP